MSFHADVDAEARTAYKQGRNREAALLWQQAASAAAALGLRAAWFSYLVWAADATWLHGDVQASLALLLRAREQEPVDAPAYEAWVARKKQFEIVLTTRPARQRLAALLAELRTRHASHPVSAVDLDYLHGEWLANCGQWQAALARFEAGWVRHNEWGYSKYNYADWACQMALRLANPLAARDWLRALHDCADDFAEKHAMHAWRQLALARLEHASAPELAALLRSLTDLALPLQDDAWRDRLRQATVRIHLLDARAGDPGARHHPSRAALRQRPASRQHVHERYENRLLLLDYRLACVRFAAGLAAVDDEYAPAVPQAAAPVAALTAEQMAHLRYCLGKARATARWVLGYARYLDGLLECDWRQNEVAERVARLDAMAVGVLTGQ